MMINRRNLIQTLGFGTLAFSIPASLQAGKDERRQPNIILCMTDDQGWGDVGYNGHPILKTPHLDAISREGIRFERWYSGAPVCSPTRGSCLTGRHPYRYGIYFANEGFMKPQEFTIAEALKTFGYTTGHFGKWHLGTLNTKIKESNRGGPLGKDDFSPPWLNGFDICFSTEAKVPTYNPMQKPGTNQPYGTYYWTGPDQQEKDNLDGDDSRIIMDRAIPFIENAVKQDKPFFTVIWFHAPHLPVVAGTRYRAMYQDQNEAAQHYYGCISAMDEQIGRLRDKLKSLNAYHDTMMWFCSDNGPEGKVKNDHNGSAKYLRGRKRSLYEGGIRVPALLTYPAMIRQPRIINTPCSTSDYLPTVLDILGCQREGQPEPMDGVSLKPLLKGQTKQRPSPIAFQSIDQLALIDNQYKIYRSNNGKSFELYDILADPGEKNDISQQKPQIVEKMKKHLFEWRESCQQSDSGMDYK